MPHNFGNQKENENREFKNPRHEIDPIYELVRNWSISFSGKLYLTSLPESMQEKWIESISKRRNRIKNGEGKRRTR